MPWKASSSPAAATSKPMGKSKPAATSIRGQISAPIPVADSYGHLSEPKQIHLSQQAAQHGSNIRPRQAQGFDQNHTTNAADNSTPPSQVQSVDQRVTIDETAARNSTTPEVGRRLSKTQKKDAPVRKRSPIRHVIGRLFGRRKKTPSQLTTTSEPAQRSSAPPQPMAKNEKDGPSRGSGASRSVSLPITEFDRALRSHSIGLDDVIAIRSARSSLAAVDQNQPKKRSGGGGGGGGGGSNSPYTLGARYIGDGKLAGLCPRPASVNDRDLGSSSAILADDGGDPDEIGRAITGDAGRLKRRSRSMSAIPRFEAKPEEHQHQQHQDRHRRRRSQEVRELRDSCVYGQDPLSPLSSEFPEDDALAAFDLDLPNPSRPAASEPTTTTAPGPFMFGSLISEDEAANRQQVDEVTLSSRVNGIENRLHVVEDSVSLLRYKANNPHAHVGWTTGDAALPGGLGIQPSFSYPGTRHPHHSLSMGMAPASTRPSSDHSEAVFTESTSRSDGGNHGSSHTAPQQQQQQQHLSLPDDDAAARPISEQTLRGHHHHHSQNQNLPPQRHASSLLSDEQYTSLLGLLETERSARIALEAQVQQLTRQLNMLLLARHARRGHHQKASAPLAPVSVFEYDADESESFGGRRRGGGGGGGGGGSKGSSPRCSNIWHPQQHGYSLDDSGIDPGMARHASTNHDYNDDDDDDDDDDGAESASQLYATPSEETHAGAFNMYPAAEPEDGASPRTMSLSSMTMSPIPTAVM
ncbi:hypothetical protein NHJ13734_001630 [Beauveria thailandica]